jgi:hypothetical protein
MKKLRFQLQLIERSDVDHLEITKIPQSWLKMWQKKPG